MKKFFFVFLASALSVTLIPGTAQAASSDTTIHPIVCATPFETIYLAYGINSVTITNPNGCSQTNGLNLSYGSGATWTYEQTIGANTTIANYNPANSLAIDTLGTADKFTLTLTSESDVYVIIGSSFRQFNIYFNKQIDTLTPNPVALGEQVTVTGRNLSSITSLRLSEGMTSFSVNTENRTATQFTFIVPLTYLRFGVTSDIPLRTYNLQYHESKNITLTAALTTAPGAPTIGIATAISPTSASIAFVAPASDGGATIETYTATSSPGSITGRLLQAGSGTITMTGLTSSTAYTFTVTASNSVGTSMASSSSVSLTTPASAEEIAAQNSADVVAAAAAVKAAAVAAAFQREGEKRSARAEILRRYKNSEKITVELFNQAEIPGITSENIEDLHVDLFSSLPDSRVAIYQVLTPARKYEVVALIASDRVVAVYSGSLIEIGLIAEDSQHKAALTEAIKNLPEDERSSYALIKAAIDRKMAEIQAREDRLKAILARIAARRAA
jgi:hypothetical protein